MRWFGVRLQLLLTALIVLLSAAASERSHYFCRMMERTVVECCCSSEHRSHRNAAVTVRAADCCELLVASEQPVFNAHHAALAEFPVAALAATLPAFPPPELGFRLVPALPPPARAPPSLGPPLFISNCALLI